MLELFIYFGLELFKVFVLKLIIWFCLFLILKVILFLKNFFLLLGEIKEVFVKMFNLFFIFEVKIFLKCIIGI